MNKLDPIPCPLRMLAQNHPDQEAVVWGNGRAVAWDTLNAYVHSTARRLKEFGVAAGGRVVFLAPEGISYVILLLALWRVRAVACPLDPRLPLETLKNVLDILRPGLLIVDKERQDVPGRQVVLDDMVVIEPVEGFFSGTSDREEMINLDQEAVVVLTSGSSGERKPALLTYGNFYTNALGARKEVPFEPGDSWLLSLPLYHVSGLSIIFRALVGGGTIILPQNADLAESLGRSRPTHLSVVPVQLWKLLGTAGADEILRGMKCILIGGGPVSPLIVEKSRGLGLPVYVTYGMTETASQIATGKAGKGAKILPGLEVQKSPAGEIRVRGDILLKGYLEKTGLRDPRDVNGWFNTGDTGDIRDDVLTVTGRKDSMFISGGENIVPEAVEKALLGHSAVIEAVVCPKADAIFGQVPVAFVRLKDGEEFAPEALRAFLRARLLPFEIPKEFFPMPEKFCLGLKPQRQELFSEVGER